MSTVFVTQVPARRENGVWIPIMDVAPAKAFGELKILLPSGTNYPELDEALALLRAPLLLFKEEDHLLLLGDPLMMAAAVALVVDGGARRVQLLKWDRRNMRYFSFTLQL